jgi:hypothetical protein
MVYLGKETCKGIKRTEGNRFKQATGLRLRKPVSFGYLVHDLQLNILA